MKFKLTKSHRYWWPVTVRIPDPENPGQIIEQVLKVQFEPKSREEFLAAQEKAAKLTSLRALTEHEVAEARDIIRDWDDVHDDDGLLVPFSPQSLELALQQSWFRRGINEALTSSMNGEAAALGN